MHHTSTHKFRVCTLSVIQPKIYKYQCMDGECVSRRLSFRYFFFMQWISKFRSIQETDSDSLKWLWCGGGGRVIPSVWPRIISFRDLVWWLGGLAWCILLEKTTQRSVPHWNRIALDTPSFVVPGFNSDGPHFWLNETACVVPYYFWKIFSFVFGLIIKPLRQGKYFG